MALPALPLLTDDASDNDKALWLYLSHLRDSLEGFTHPDGMWVSYTYEDDEP